MKRFIILLVVFLPFTSVFCCGKKNQSKQNLKSDTTIVDTIKVPVSTLEFYQQEINKSRDSIVNLKAQLANDSNRIFQADSMLNKRDQELDSLNNELQLVRQQLNDTSALLSELYLAFDFEDFYEYIMSYPIDYTFDSTDIAHRIIFADTIHLKEKYPNITQKYYDMVANYHLYRMEVAECVKTIIDEFKISGKVKPDPDFMKENYMMKLEKTQYWSKRHIIHPEADVPFIERRLTRIDKLFEGGTDYNLTSFQQIFDELVARYDI